MRGTKFFAALVVLALTLMFGAIASNVFAETYYYVGTGGFSTIQTAFDQLKEDYFNDITGKGHFIIQVQDEAVYEESVTLEGLTTTEFDTLTLRKFPSLSGRPTIDATLQSGEAIKITTVAYVTIEGFTLKAKQNMGDRQYRVLWANQTGLNEGQLIVKNNVFDGQGPENDPVDQCALLQVMPMRIDCLISENEFTNYYDNDDSCPLLSVYTDDSGGEPLDVPEVIISDNDFHDNVVNAVIYNSDDYEHTGIIERNRIYNNRCPTTSDRNRGGTIVFDRNNGRMVVRNNLIYNNDWSRLLPERGAIYLYRSDNKGIYNNTLYNNKASGGQIYVDGDSGVGIEVKNNIIWPTPGGGYCIYLEAGAEITSATNLFYADFDNDGVYDSGTDYVAYKRTGRGKKQFEAYLLADWQRKYEVSPDYSLYDMPDFDVGLHIKDSSPCIDAGVYVIDVLDDIDRDSRPQGAGYDIGADESFVSGVHDVAIVSIDVPSEVGQGPVSVGVIVWNGGTFEETTTVTLIDITDDVEIGSQEVTLSAGASETVTFDWDTTDASLGTHTLRAEAILTGDEDPADNVKETTVNVVEGTLYVKVETDKTSYALGQWVHITVTVTGDTETPAPVEGASVNITIKTASGKKYGEDGTTDASGKAFFEFRSKKPDGTGTYIVTADASKSGYVSGSGSTTFEVTPKPAPALARAYSTGLGNVYPSPANPETWIPFTLSESEHVVIRIYNATGQLVRTLDLGQKDPGAYVSKGKAIHWDGRNEAGETVTSGIYFYQFKAGQVHQTRKMTVLK